MTPNEPTDAAADAEQPPKLAYMDKFAVDEAHIVKGAVQHEFARLTRDRDTTIESYNRVLAERDRLIEAIDNDHENMTFDECVEAMPDLHHADKVLRRIDSDLEPKDAVTLLAKALFDLDEALAWRRRVEELQQQALADEPKSPALKLCEADIGNYARYVISLLHWGREARTRMALAEDKIRRVEEEAAKGMEEEPRPSRYGNPDFYVDACEKWRRVLIQRAAVLQEKYNSSILKQWSKAFEEGEGKPSFIEELGQRADAALARAEAAEADNAALILNLSKPTVYNKWIQNTNESWLCVKCGAELYWKDDIGQKNNITDFRHKSNCPALQPHPGSALLDELAELREWKRTAQLLGPNQNAELEKLRLINRRRSSSSR